MNISIDLSKQDEIDLTGIMASLRELDPNLVIVSLCPTTYRPRIRMKVDSVNHEVFTILKLSYDIEAKVFGNEV